jgi:hypothetical protein
MTFEAGWEPAQALSVTLTSRNISAASFVIMEVESELTEYVDMRGVYVALGQRLWGSTLRASETTAYQGSWLDQARQLFGTGGSTGGGVISGGGGGGGGSTTVLSSPFPLGGSDQARINMADNPTVLREVLNYNQYVATANFSGRVRAWVWAQSAVYNLRVSLWDGYVEQQSSVVNAASRVAGAVTFNVTIVAGMTYTLHAKSDTTGVGVYCIGQLESL